MIKKKKKKKQTHPKFFIGNERGADPEAINDLCLILTNMV
jgi:hypothetical protein